MKPLKNNLMKQLFTIGVIIVGIISLSLIILLPKLLLPIYEKNIYEYLKQPLELIDNNINNNYNVTSADIAYIYIRPNDEIVASNNFSSIINADYKFVLEKADKEFGNFRYLGKTYYYYTMATENDYRLSISTNNYILEIRKDILVTIYPILFITLLIISALLVFWASNLALKIEHLKEKIDNLDNEDYIDNYSYDIDDELKVLSEAIDNMKIHLKKEEEYKNQMYQNISHDFKTPLTVIKSYLEAVEDGVETEAEAAKIIKEQINKLEIKVHSLLYLNKLNYIKDYNEYKNQKVDLSQILKSCIQKFQIQRPEITFKISIMDKNSLFNGTFDMWETIIDNILNNFMRYAEKLIKVTIKNGKITFYNDGPHINKNVLDDIFTPYTKGIKGQFGLGLSIVKKTVTLLGYEIVVKNERKGVSFMIR